MKLYLFLLLPLITLSVKGGKPSRRPSSICTTSKTDSTMIECKELNLKPNETLNIHHSAVFKKLKLHPPLKELPPRIFATFPQLETLIINYTLMEKISESSFDGLPDLFELDLFWNQISYLPPKIFQTCCRKLQYLNLGGNNMETIDNRVFQRMKHLRNLVLSSNFLTSVVKIELEGLKYLDLSKNRIKELTAGCFAHLTGLTHLNLRNNQIKYVAEEAFRGLESMKFLNLERNELVEAKVVTLTQNMPKLVEVRINMNNFTCPDLEKIIGDFRDKKVDVPEGLGEPEVYTYHGIFCWPENTMVN